MRSRAERALRAASFALMAFAMWRMATDRGARDALTVRASSLSGELASIETSRLATLHVVVDAMPAPADRDALAAMAHAGTWVTWSAPIASRSQSRQALPTPGGVAARGAVGARGPAHGGGSAARAALAESRGRRQPRSGAGRSGAGHGRV